MTKSATRKAAIRRESATPVLMPDVSELATLFANRNQSLLKFYFDRLHQYETFYARAIDDYRAQLERFFDITMDDDETSESHEIEDYESVLLRAQSDAAEIIEQAKLQAERIIEGAYTRSEKTANSRANTGRASRRKSA